MSTPTVRLAPGETALFGYGSLCSIVSLERTLGRKYDGPFVRCELDGWRRSWDIGMPNRTFYYEAEGVPIYPEQILYLNVTKASGTRLNGVLFVTDTPELARFDQREWIYDRVRVTDELRGVSVDGGDAYVYVAKAEYIVREPKSARQAAIRRSYLNILEAAFADLGEEFRRAYDASSDQPPPALIVEDRRDSASGNPFSSGSAAGR